MVLIAARPIGLWGPVLVLAINDVVSGDWRFVEVAMSDGEIAAVGLWRSLGRICIGSCRGKSALLIPGEGACFLDKHWGLSLSIVGIYCAYCLGDSSNHSIGSFQISHICNNAIDNRDLLPRKNCSRDEIEQCLV